jgi:hypothetical protein
MLNFRNCSWNGTLVGLICLAGVCSTSTATLASSDLDNKPNAVTSGNLIAQTTTADPLPDTSGKQISEQFSNFLSDSFRPTNPTIVLPVLVENFVYVNGGVGRPEGDVNTGFFNFFFKENFGVLCGSSVAVLPPPVTCKCFEHFVRQILTAKIERMANLAIRFFVWRSQIILS